MENEERKQEHIPSEYQPISSWGYIGYNILFSIPLVGLILLIVFSLDNSNINRRNFARSFFCVIILATILVLLFGTSILAALSSIVGNYQT